MFGPGAGSSFTQTMLYAPSISIVGERLGPSLLKSGEEGVRSTEACLRSCDIVGLYFGKWNKPCRGFTRKLVDSYKENNEARRIMEIVFLSMDNDEAPFRDCFAEMPWLAVPLHEGGRRALLARELCVTEPDLPCLILLDARDGSTISRNGRPPSMDDLVRHKNPMMEGFAGLGAEDIDGARM